MFHEHTEIDEIIIVTNALYVEQTEEIVRRNAFTKVVCVLKGGNERYDSTLAALNRCPEEESKLIIHDAVRPLVTATMITDCIRALEDYPACTTAIATTDTILVSNANRDCVKEIPSRHFLFNVQTPQAFRSNVLRQAYEKAMQDPAFQATDDCGVVSKYLPEATIKIVAGSSSNLKITWPEDLITAGKLLTGLTDKNRI